uniref:RRM domain-containing protein n=1 Tax=Lactuca sativa TaxID=4236 RepID=A0A9R1US44_LACSA|nr:hypothetical protein LSAT_V11C800415370 [Lactuca sativa]
MDCPYDSSASSKRNVELQANHPCKCDMPSRVKISRTPDNPGKKKSNGGSGSSSTSGSECWCWWCCSCWCLAVCADFIVCWGSGVECDGFAVLGQVVSVRVCRDLSTRRSLGYGYVNYANPQDAARAMEVLNFTPLNGKAIRIMYSHRDPSVRKSGSGNIFIKILDKAIDQKALHDTFSIFGNILSCRIVTDSSGQSKGYGFVQYDAEESAQKAIEKLKDMLLNDKQVYVGPFLRKQERELVVDKTKFTNVYVKNLSESTTYDDLNKTFSEFGTVTSVVVMRDAEGNSECFGFVNFENVGKAVEGLNGQKFDNKEWYVGKAHKKYEREQELKQRFEKSYCLIFESARTLKCNFLEWLEEDDYTVEKNSNLGQIYNLTLKLGNLEKEISICRKKLEEEKNLDLVFRKELDKVKCKLFTHKVALFVKFCM